MLDFAATFVTRYAITTISEQNFLTMTKFENFGLKEYCLNLSVKTRSLLLIMQPSE